MNANERSHPTLSAAFREAGRQLQAAYREGVARAKAERAAKPSEGLRTTLHRLALRLAEATKPDGAQKSTITNTSIVMQPGALTQDQIDQAFRTFTHALSLRLHV